MQSMHASAGRGFVRVARRATRDRTSGSPGRGPVRRMRRMQGRRHPPEDGDRAWRRALPLRLRLRRRLEADIFIESVRDGEADVDYPTFVGGERRCLPEDVGRVPGFMEFLEAALDPLDVKHNEVVSWYGKPFNPVDIGRARRAAKACHAGRPPPGRPREASRHSADPDST